jgi:hypothetical protein
MPDESKTVDSKTLSMEDLLAAFVADPLEDVDITTMSELRKKLMKNFPVSRPKTRFDSDNHGSPMLEEAAENDKSLSESSAISARGYDELLLKDFFQLDGSGEESGEQEITHSQVSSIELKMSGISKEAHLQEVDRLKCVIMEAQETIIQLLTDRVDDRSKIATLEAQLRHLPLQQLGDANALQLRTEQEQLRTQLIEVRHEIQKYETEKMRNRMNNDNPKRGFVASSLAKIFGCP